MPADGSKRSASERNWQEDNLKYYRSLNSSMSTFFRITFLWFAIICFILSACSSASTSSIQDPGETVTIRWRTRTDTQAEQEMYQQINDRLNEQLMTQGIQLVFDPVPSLSYLRQINTEISQGNAPDIFWIPAQSIPEYAGKEMILDLRRLVRRDHQFELDDFYAAPLEELQQGDGLWGLPRDISTLVMYYNKDLFQKYGLEDPAELAARGEWTCDNFRRLAIELTHPEERIYGFGMTVWWATWGWFVYSHGGNFFNQERTACALTDPVSQQGLQFLADLYQKDKVGRPPGSSGGGGETVFLNGLIGMLPNGRWFTPGLRKNAHFNWGVVEMPNCGQLSSWMFWGAYVINARAQKPEQAWIVLKALTASDVQAQAASLGTAIPSIKDKAAVDAFLSSKPPEDNQPFLNSAGYAQPEMALFTGSWGEIVDGQYQPYIISILTGNSSVESATQTACQGADPLFK